ncbi:hypothetical protein DSL72_009045 [Monilinia vaccinii-corymbosi]|uniref:Uncharacterized protein n=1 Tax=Monilinia vaccinii-corymbosi TaxID=61207 RepID=A0A8A3PPX7_9HELO|nr:hypothetical protein DSL72_009045 [Monilinia vaccinii-corymbosi]
MCFGHIIRCKQCHKDTISYVSTCDQYPEVQTETPTHAIRGRHIRRKACRDCKRENQRHQDAEEQRQVDNYPRAKAVVEWLRLERPLPLRDEEISRKYSRLFLAEAVAEHRNSIMSRVDEVIRARKELEGPLSDETEIAVMIVLYEGYMFDEALKRQAEIDSGERTMTDDSSDFWLLLIGEPDTYENALKLIAAEKRRRVTTFTAWTSHMEDRWVTEDRLQGAIDDFLSHLRAIDAPLGISVGFQDLVIQCHSLDELVFDFDPNTVTNSSGDQPAFVAPNALRRRIPFQKWVVDYEGEKLGDFSRQGFYRWYSLLNAYRTYLAEVAPAQQILFNYTRNVIAAATFRTLTGRSDREPTLRSSGESAESSGSGHSPTNGANNTGRQSIFQCVQLLDGILGRANQFTGELSASDHHFNQLINSCTGLLNRVVDCNAFPTEGDYLLIEKAMDQANEILTDMEKTRDAEANAKAKTQSEAVQSEAVQPEAPQSEPQQDLFFFVDLEPEPNAVALAQHECQEPLEFYEDMNEEMDEYGSVDFHQDIDEPWWP